jgi:hypothetical protein
MAQILKGQYRQIFYLRFFPSEVSTWVPNSHPKIFSSFASSSWSYLNLKFDFLLHQAVGESKKDRELGEFYDMNLIGLV